MTVVAEVHYSVTIEIVINVMSADSTRLLAKNAAKRWGTELYVM